MAAPTVTLDYPKPARLGNTAMGVLSGSVDITSYDTAHPEVTAITGHFLPDGLLRVTPNGVSSSGDFLVAWDATSKSFLAYSAVGTEGTSSASVGTVDFIAVGQL